MCHLTDILPYFLNVKLTTANPFIESFDLTMCDWLSISVRILFLSVFVKKIVIDTISNLGVDLLQLLNDDFSCPDFRVVHDLLYYPLVVRINRSKTSYTLWGFKLMILYSRVRNTYKAIEVDLKQACFGTFLKTFIT